MVHLVIELLCVRGRCSSSQPANPPRRPRSLEPGPNCSGPARHSPPARTGTIRSPVGDTAASSRRPGDTTRTIRRTDVHPNLPAQKPGPIDAEKHSAHTAGAHRFDVDSLGQTVTSPPPTRDTSRDCSSIASPTERRTIITPTPREKPSSRKKERSFRTEKVAECEGDEHRRAGIAGDRLAASSGAMPSTMDDATGLGGKALVVGDHHQRGGVAIEPAEELRISLPVVASSSPVGSSASRRPGRFANALAIATRCISPPESWVARWLVRWAKPTYSSSSRARRRLSAWQLPPPPWGARRFRGR